MEVEREEGETEASVVDHEVDQREVAMTQGAAAELDPEEEAEEVQVAAVEAVLEHHLVTEVKPQALLIRIHNIWIRHRVVILSAILLPSPNHLHLIMGINTVTQRCLLSKRVKIPPLDRPPLFSLPI